MERSTQYTSFSSRKQPANAGTERKQFTENASVALQQPILTHAHTKCPPVGDKLSPNFQRIKRLYHHPDYSDLGGASDFFKQTRHDQSEAL